MSDEGLSPRKVDATGGLAMIQLFPRGNPLADRCA